MIIQLDKPREISFTMYALKKFKEITGRSIISDGTGELDEETMCQITYAGICGADHRKIDGVRKPDIEIEDIEDFLNFAQFQKVLEKLTYDLTKNTGEEGEKK